MPWMKGAQKIKAIHHHLSQVKENAKIPSRTVSKCDLDEITKFSSDNRNLNFALRQGIVIVKTSFLRGRTFFSGLLRAR